MRNGRSKDIAAGEMLEIDVPKLALVAQIHSDVETAVININDRKL